MEAKKKCYAVKNYRANMSSSGGAVPLIHSILSKEGQKDKKVILYGAAFDDGMNVVHIRADSEKGFSAISGSKYVRSSLKGIPEQVIADLNDGRKVLFTGTPCQVEAVNQFLARTGRTNLDNFFSVDLVCHGTPYHKIWEAHKSYLENIFDSKLAAFGFRDKDAAEDSGRLWAKFENGKEVHDAKELKQYMTLFSTNLSLCENCFHCKHRNETLSRPADVTVGDFWGAKEIFSPLKHVKGDISLVMPNTDKGKLIIEGIIQQSQISKDVLIVENITDEFLIYNDHLCRQTPKPAVYDMFWKDYAEMPYSEVVEKYTKQTSRKALKAKLIHYLNRLGLKYKAKRILHSLVKH